MTVVLSGDKALERKLKRLTQIEERRAVSKAVRKAVRPWTKEAKKIVKQGTESGTGHFAKSIATKVKSYQKGGLIVAMTGVSGKVDPVTGENPIKIAHLLEEDTQPHFVRSKKVGGGPGAILSNINDPRLDSNTNQDSAVFGFEVKHPGTRGLHMFKKSFARKHREAARIYQRALQIAIEREATRGGFKA